MSWKRKHILGLEEMTADEIYTILEKSKIYLDQIERKETGSNSEELKGYNAVNLFFEHSTRTRMSFELAQKRLGMEVLNFHAVTSSVSKGETFIDTIETVSAMDLDVMVIRHVKPGTPELATKHTTASVINGGDGSREHPTQALLDLMTMWLKGKDFAGLKVAIVGDILHSRVARSEIFGLEKLGAEVILVGPPPLIPGDLSRKGIEISHDIDEVLDYVDVLYLLRIQRERMAEVFIPDEEEYFRTYGLDRTRLDKTKDSCLVMHPGPVNRGVEIAVDIVNDKKSVILEQVRNGVAVRMALLSLLLKG